jgi:ABC-type branched-subunit amino acid transport system substrate-binding protein
MINDRGGVNGRKINFISADDGYSPPKTVEQIRRLVEQATRPGKTIPRSPSTSRF